MSKELTLKNIIGMFMLVISSMIFCDVALWGTIITLDITKYSGYDLLSILPTWLFMIVPSILFFCLYIFHLSIYLGGELKKYRRSQQ